MPLVGLKGGGAVAMDSTAISTQQDHALGTVALDSSGGEYVYTRGSSASTAAVGRGVLIGSSFNVTLLPVANADPGPIGILCSTNASTATFGWVQTFGMNERTLLSCQSAANVQLYVSSVTVGLITSTGTTAQQRILGMSIVSTGSIAGATDTSYGTVLLNHPHGLVF